MNRPGFLLFVDDDPDERQLLQQILNGPGNPLPVRLLSDGQALLDYLLLQEPYADREAHPLPALILLDLNMPGKDGRQVLKEIKAHPTLRRIPVLMLTTSQNEIDTSICFQLGCSGFFTKPATYEGLAALLETIRHYWLETTQLPRPVPLPQPVGCA